MGCLKLHDGFSSELRLILSKKPQKGEKKTGCCYPFGLEQQKPGTMIGSTNLGQKFKFNGVELNETLGLYEMPFRQYDPAIARFTSIDPVVHYEYSTYSAFDNNPVFFADPSGANSTSFIMDIFNNTPDDGLIHHYNSEGEETGTSDPDEESDDEGSENEDCCPGGVHPMGMYKAAESRAKMNGTSIEEEQEKLLGEYLDVQQEEGVDHITYAIPGGILLKVAFKGGSWIYRLYRGSKLIGAAKSSSKVLNASKQARQWLGKDYRTITNKAGDKIFMSKDGLRKMRFDVKNPHGDAPHIHLEIFKNGKWKDALQSPRAF